MTRHNDVTGSISSHERYLLTDSADLNRWINAYGVMQGVTGISSMSFSGMGLYGKLIGIIGISVGLLFAYQYFFKHAQIEAVGNLVKTFLILVVTLLFFSNYATVLKGANSLTIEASDMIMGAGSSLSEDGLSARQSMGNNMWDLFVHRPYIYMQYGTDKESEVGESLNF